jgi:hypothetical protein
VNAAIAEDAQHHDAAIASIVANALRNGSQEYTNVPEAHKHIQTVANLTA